MPSVTDTRITLRWSDEQQLPVEDEFVYLLARQNASGEKKTAEALKDPNSEGSEFDRLYFVDYCPNKAEIVRIIRLGGEFIHNKIQYLENFKSKISDCLKQEQKSFQRQWLYNDLEKPLIREENVTQYSM